MTSKITFFCVTSTDSVIADMACDLFDADPDGEIFEFILGSTAAQQISNPLCRVPFTLDSKQSLFSWCEWKKLYGVLRKSKAWPLLIYSTAPYNFLVALMGLALGIRISIWIHDARSHEGERLHLRLLYDLQRMVYSLFSFKLNFLCASGLNAKQFKTLFPSRMAVIPFPSVGKIVRSAKAFHPEARSGYVFFGRLEKYKGIVNLMDAFRGTELDEYLTVVGKGEFSDDVQEAQQKCSRIVHKGYIPNTELGKLLAESRVAIFPYLSATSTAVIQTALDCGCLVLAADIPTFKEIETSRHPNLWIEPLNDVDQITKAMIRIKDRKPDNIPQAPYFGINEFKEQLSQTLIATNVV
ncbi:MAG: glycosyltransferase [Verrucomicrobiota bacterium]